MPRWQFVPRKYGTRCSEDPSPVRTLPAKDSCGFLTVVALSLPSLSLPLCGVFF